VQSILRPIKASGARMRERFSSSYGVRGTHQSQIDIAFLVLVLTAFGGFAVTVAWCGHCNQSRRVA